MESSDNSRFGGVLPEDPQSSIKKNIFLPRNKKKKCGKDFRCPPNPEFQI